MSTRAAARMWPRASIPSSHRGSRSSCLELQSTETRAAIAAYNESRQAKQARQARQSEPDRACAGAVLRARLLVSRSLRRRIDSELHFNAERNKKSDRRCTLVTNGIGIKDPNGSARSRPRCDFAGPSTAIYRAAHSQVELMLARFVVPSVQALAPSASFRACTSPRFASFAELPRHQHVLPWAHVRRPDG
ncbi:unnamed protein product [Lampetra planeri]